MVLCPPLPTTVVWPVAEKWTLLPRANGTVDTMRAMSPGTSSTMGVYHDEFYVVVC